MFNYRNVNFDLAICSILEGAFGKCTRAMKPENSYPTKQADFLRRSGRVRATARDNNRRVIER